jgi:Domain of unknown function (DUF4167)
MPDGNNRPTGARRNDRRRGGKRPAAAAASGARDPGRQHAISLANAKRNYDRYMALARDAASAGDPVERENFYQHAEHYLRTMRDLAGRNEESEESATSRDGVPAV